VGLSIFGCVVGMDGCSDRLQTARREMPTQPGDGLSHLQES